MTPSALEVGVAMTAVEGGVGPASCGAAYTVELVVRAVTPTLIVPTPPPVDFEQEATLKFMCVAMKDPKLSSPYMIAFDIL